MVMASASVRVLSSFCWLQVLQSCHTTRESSYRCVSELRPHADACKGLLIVVQTCITQIRSADGSL